MLLTGISLAPTQYLFITLSINNVCIMSYVTRQDYETVSLNIGRDKINFLN